MDLVDDEPATQYELKDKMDKVQAILRRRTYFGMAGFLCLLFLLIDPPYWIPIPVLVIISPTAGAGVGLWLSALALHLARRLSEKGSG